VPLQQSTFTVGYYNYDIARTAAGFGSVFISPVHAAMIAAAVGNDGKMLRPYLIDRIEDARGSVTYQSRPTVLKSSVMTSTAEELLHIMKSTVETGTARKHFARFRGGATFPVAAKTGTLSGTNPKGLYHWFIATAPVANPSIAIATLVIDPGNARVKAGALGSRFLQYYHALETEGLAAAESTVREVQPTISRKKRRESVVKQARPVRGAASSSRGTRSFTPKPFSQAVGAERAALSSGSPAVAARKPSPGKVASPPVPPVKKSKSAQKQPQPKSASKKSAAHKGKERG
jgi:membrane peptidoglycan carboxypeptidase